MEASVGLGCIQVEVGHMDPSGSPGPLVCKRRKRSGAPLGVVDDKGAGTSQVSFIPHHHLKSPYSMVEQWLQALPDSPPRVNITPHKP